MILETIKLTNFRNLSGRYNLSSGINTIIGDNGAGKTNLLESVGFLSFGKSFRTNSELSVIKKTIPESDEFVFMRIESDIVDYLGNKSLREVIVERNYYGKKILKIDGQRIPLAKFSQEFNSVIFSPNTIDLIISTPSVRRRDLDDFITTIDEDYFDEISEYRKVVRNKNKILEKGSTQNELKYWNEKQIELGSRIIYKRLQAIHDLNPKILDFAPDLFNLEVEDLKIEYISKFTKSDKLKDIKDALSAKINSSSQKEIRAKTTLYGPQREDFKFLLNGDDISEFGSRGQQRLCSFIYKLAQWEVLKSKKGSAPILLLDDLFSELDRKVRSATCEFLNTIEGQVILTALSKKEINDGKLKEIEVIELI